MTTALPPPGRVFYGWYVVVAVLVITTTTSGLAFYNLSILLAAFISERGFPVALASSATATFFIATGIGGMIAGRLVDRIDARAVIVTSASIGALALASVGVLRETWELFAFHVVFGLAHGATGLVPVTTVVARWFNARRALAFSVASTGLSLGGVIVAPFVAFAIERLGLAGAGPWMGAALFIGVVPVTVLVLRASPAAMGLRPDGAPADDAHAPVPQPATPYAVARRTPYFYAVSAAYLFLLGAQVGAIAHLYRLAGLRDGTATAALTVAVLAACSTIGRLLGGWLLLTVPPRAFALVLMGVQAMSLAWLALALDRAALLGGAVAFGLTIGNSLMMHPLLLAERFGVRDYGRIYSTSQLVTVIGVAGCPALVGLLFDLSGDYALPFFAIAGLTLVGLTILATFGGARTSAAVAPSA